jgi:hypothetical protein
MNLSDYYPQNASFKNKIINGAMDIWQRGTTFTGVGVANTFSTDRFFWGQSLAGGVVTLSRETNVPNQNFNYSLRATVTTADAAIVAGDSYLLAQRIEGFNIVDLIGNTFTLSFWVRSPKTGIHCVSFRSNLATASYVTEYTILAANTWEYKTITVTGGINASIGGPWDTTNGLGMAVSFPLATGSTRQTATTDAWVAGDFQATAAAVNCMDTIGNVFAITGVQLERGAVATPFEHRPIGTEFELCQRYYQTPGVNLATSGSGLQVQFSGNWTTRMRVTPSITFTGTVPTVSTLAWRSSLQPGQSCLIATASAEL